MLLRLLALMCAISTAQAVDFVSVGDNSAILYDAPSAKARKQFVVSRYTPFEEVVTLDLWVKVRDRTGGLYWLEKRALSKSKYVVAEKPLVNAHTEPLPGSACVFKVRAEVALELLEATGTGWVKVRHRDGETGFVRSNEVWGE